MKLSEAYNNWSQAPRNTVLSAKYRTGVNTVLMKQYGDTDLSAFTKEFSIDLMRKSPAAHELKVQAASALVYTLQWGGDHGHCPRPSFAFSEIVPSKDNLRPSVSPCSDHQEQKAPEAPRRAGGRPPKAVAQIDPDTLTVVKTWPCMAEVDDALGIGKGAVSRAVKKHQKAAGFYWCFAEDIDTYIQELKVRHVGGRFMRMSTQRPGVTEKKETVAELKKQYEVFNEMRPVAKVQPEALPKVILGSRPVFKPSPEQALSEISDTEIFAELERRGWHGYFSKTTIQAIGIDK